MTIKSKSQGQLEAIQTEALLAEKEVQIEQKNCEIARLNQQLEECDRQINGLKSEFDHGLQELKLKYKGLIAQFVMNSHIKQQINNQHKSLQACKNIFIKAQNKVNLLQCENKLLEQRNLELQGKVRMLRV